MQKLKRAIDAAIARLESSPLRRQDKELFKATLRPLQEATLALESDNDDDGAAIADELAQRVDALLLELYQRATIYDRVRDIADAAEQEICATQLLKLKDGIVDFFTSRKQLILDDFDQEHHAWSNIQDTGRKAFYAAKWVASSVEDLADTAGQKLGRGSIKRRMALDDAAKTESAPLEQRLCLRHLPEQEVKARITELADQAQDGFQRQWKKAATSMQAALPHNEAWSQQLLPHSDISLQLPSDLSTVIGGQLAGSAVLASVVLAAGWHTSAWVMSNFFMPLALVSAMLYVGVAKLREGTEKKKRRDDLRAQLDKGIEQIGVDVEGRVGPFMRANAKQIAVELKTKSAQGLLCRAGKKHFDALVAELEKLQQKIGRLKFPGAVVSDPKQAFAQARERVDGGDSAGAALLSAVAFESAVLAWAQSLNLLHGLRGEGQLYTAIESLRADNHCTQAQYQSLHRLRRERNRAVHDIGFVIKRPNAAHLVRTFIDEATAVLGL